MYVGGREGADTISAGYDLSMHPLSLPTVDAIFTPVSRLHVAEMMTSR